MDDRTRQLVHEKFIPPLDNRPIVSESLSMSTSKKPRWKDITSFSETDKERMPRTWELSFGGFRLIVTRHRAFAPDMWVMTCAPWWTMPIEIGAMDVDLARRIAIDRVRFELQKAIELLP